MGHSLHAGMIAGLGRLSNTIQTDLFLLAAQLNLAHIFKRYVTPFCQLFA